MRLGDAEAEIGSATCVEALWEIFFRFFRGTDVQRVSYLHFPPVGAPDSRELRIRSDGFPEALISRYIEERLYRHNPVVTLARDQLEPVYWDDALRNASLTSEEREFVEAFHAAGLGEGVGIPVYGPNGRDGHCGLGFVAGVRRLPPEVLSEYQWVCQLAHLRYCALLQSMFGPQPKLSGREIEVLGWVARGKSNGLIGEILGISAHTVDAHMRRICLKLGVSDRISAAIRGIGIGVVHATN